MGARAKLRNPESGSRQTPSLSAASRIEFQASAASGVSLMSRPEASWPTSCKFLASAWAGMRES